MIKIRNLHLRYPDGTWALNGLDLTIHRGEFLLICGPNGSGKTTLMRLIAGLLRPTEGTISMDGLDRLHACREAHHRVGLVFQDADSQILGETVREDIAFGPENLKLPREEIAKRVEKALEALGLEKLSDKPCYLLSGGEKRRLAIAGAIAMEPEVMIFDEPFSNLDYEALRETLKHMVRFHREGHTLIVTTHDVEKVIAHVDRVAVLFGGELKLYGTPEEVIPRLRDFGIRPPCYALLGGEKISWLE